MRYKNYLQLVIMFLVLAAMAKPLRVTAQLQDSSRTVLHVGLLRNTVNPFSEGTVSIERSFHHRVSILGTIGLNPFTRNLRQSFAWRFYWHISLEARYYFALRRHRMSSGFFLGAYACHDDLKAYYRHSSQQYLHDYWSSIGPVLGYQHAFGSRFRASSGLMMVFYAKETEEFFDTDGNLLSRNFLPRNYTYFFYLRVGMALAK